jgi:AraC-like DNA-binding protein
LNHQACKLQAKSSGILPHDHISELFRRFKGYRARTVTLIKHFSNILDAGATSRSRKVTFNHFDVFAQPVEQQLLAWRERMGQIIDVVPSLSDLERSFRGSITRYELGELIFADCYTDRITLDRTIARISRDNARSIIFHVFLEATPGNLLARSTKRGDVELNGGIVAVDLDQPVRLLRGSCRHITIIVPRHLLHHLFPDPGALHGRVLLQQTPAGAYLVGRVTYLAERLRFMAADHAHRELQEIVDLITDAFAQQAGLKGSQRAIVRAMAFDHARSYVSANLSDSDLSPEQVVDSVGLARPTIYRLFQHEGGLSNYIRDVRLREAASNLIRFPDVPVQEISAGVGFKSASDFSRAFRRAYGIAPQDARQQAVFVHPNGFRLN